MNDEPKEDPQASLAKNEVTSGSSPQTELPSAPNVAGIPPEILDKLPASARSMVEFSMMQMGPMPNPLVQHVNATHIDKALDNAEKSDARQAEAHMEEVKDRKHNRITTWVGVTALALILGALWFWVPADKLGSLQEVVKNLVSLGAVAFGGYGYALSKFKDKD